jgi:hypothetical protein
MVLLWPLQTTEAVPEILVGATEISFTVTVTVLQAV